MNNHQLKTMNLFFTSNKIKICLLCIAISVLTNCKNASIDYKYSSESDMFQCEIANQDLFKEALYAFENYIETYYIASPPSTLSQGYAFYWEIAIRDQMPALELFDDHLIKLVEALKNINELWLPIQDGYTLNHNHEIMRCIANDIKDSNASKELLNLLNTNSYQPNLFMSAIGSQANNLIDDKALATYFALNKFYAKVIDIDFNTIKKKTEYSNLND